jgi:Phage integrase, N-terminal SAM-like domain
LNEAAGAADAAVLAAWAAAWFSLWVTKEDSPVTHLRQLMLDELQRRNYSPNTVRSYVQAVEDFARYFRRPPEQLGPNHVRDYQVHLFRDRKLSPRTIEGRTAALRFLFVKTLRRPYLPDAIPFPKQHTERRIESSIMNLLTFYLSCPKL